MNVFVFAGPTLAGTEKERELDAIFLPPAEAGDVYRASLLRPQAIGIIDGYFQTRPAVRHKEILWAMSQGIHVFGSASMGALRAAELSPFGMEGVGKIFEWYRDGSIEDDDEVTIAHASEQEGYTSLSDAMVNIRQTLRFAEQSGVISACVRKQFEVIAKGLFYPNRTYSSVLSHAADSAIPQDIIESFRQWIPKGRVDQKKEDAVAMLRQIKSRISSGLKPKVVSFSFENTAMWESARRQAGKLHGGSDGDFGMVQLELLLDELRLDPEEYCQAKLLSIERYFALREWYRLNMRLSEDSVGEIDSWFERKGTTNRIPSTWKSDNDLSDAEFAAFRQDEARLHWVHRRLRFAGFDCMADHLRAAGTYSKLRRRALAKARLLSDHGERKLIEPQADTSEDKLIKWYFEEIAKQSLPDDLTKFWRALDFSSRDAFLRMVRREYFFRILQTATI